MHTGLGRAEMLGGSGGRWLMAGQGVQEGAEPLEGLAGLLWQNDRGERTVPLQVASWGGGGILSLTLACPSLWQGALLAASSMGSIILKPPACANPQDNPSSLFEIRAGNGWGGGDPFFAKVRATVRTSGPPHSPSPQNQTIAASLALSPPLPGVQPLCAPCSAHICLWFAGCVRGLQKGTL